MPPAAAGSAVFAQDGPGSAAYLVLDGEMAVIEVVDAFARAAPQADDIACLALVYRDDPELAGA